MDLKRAAIFLAASTAACAVYTDDVLPQSGMVVMTPGAVGSSAGMHTGGAGTVAGFSNVISGSGGHAGNGTASLGGASGRSAEIAGEAGAESVATAGSGGALGGAAGEAGTTAGTAGALAMGGGAGAAGMNDGGAGTAGMSGGGAGGMSGGGTGSAGSTSGGAGNGGTSSGGTGAAGAGGTGAPECAIDSDCNDGSICTKNTCVNGSCTSVTDHEGETCNDGNANTCSDKCASGKCVGTTACGPCADRCANPKNINNQANPATTGAICYERTSSIQGANVGNVTGAGVQVNGQAVTSTGNVSPWPAKRFGGYCFESSKAFGWLSIF